MTDRAIQRSAFCTRRGLFEFTRMPFGLKGPPATFCLAMNLVFADLLWLVCIVYLDDIIVFAQTQEELLQRLDMVLTRLARFAFKVKPSKCVFFRKEIQFLGHIVWSSGIAPYPDKLQAIRDWPTPHCLKEVHAFYGTASYYRRFVKNFAKIAEPLSNLFHKSAKPLRWTPEAQQAFERLKAALLETPILQFPHPHLPCILDTDASDVALGAVLSQVIQDQERPIAFFSRVMNKAQRSYCTTRREFLATITALQHFRHYLLGVKVNLRTDHHSLKWLNTFKRPKGVLARWIETLIEFDYEIQHRPGRLRCNADGVSRPICKQCWCKTVRIPWVDQPLQRADEITEPLAIQTLRLNPELDDSDIANMQRDDEVLAPIIDWLATDYHPTPDDIRTLPLAARMLWSQRANLILSCNVLVSNQSSEDHTKLVVPAVLQRRLFDAAHAGPLQHIWVPSGRYNNYKLRTTGPA